VRASRRADSAAVSAAMRAGSICTVGPTGGESRWATAALVGASIFSGSIAMKSTLFCGIRTADLLGGDISRETAFWVRISSF